MKGNYTYEDLVEYEIAKEITEWNRSHGEKPVPRTPQLRRALEIMEDSEKSAPMRRAEKVMKIYEDAAKVEQFRKEINELNAEIARILEQYRQLSVHHAALVMTIKPISFWTRIKNALFKTDRT
jgi:hypothetical protein